MRRVNKDLDEARVFPGLRKLRSRGGCPRTLSDYADGR
jgi:hypothetical protein